MSNMSNSIQSSIASNSTGTATDSSNEYLQTYLTPFALVVDNLPRPKSNGYKPLGKHLSERLDFDIERVLTAYKEGQPKGYAVLVFGKTRTHFIQAMMLHSSFDEAKHGVMEWAKIIGSRNDNQPYGWLADKDDLPLMGHYKEDFVPFTAPENWIEEAIDTATANNINMYRVVRLFAPRMNYREFP